MATSAGTTLPQWGPRSLAMLRAIAHGRAEMSLSCEPDLFVDGLPCCDQFAAHQLSHGGLVEPARLGLLGQRVPARLTPAGRTVFDANENGLGCAS